MTPLEQLQFRDLRTADDLADLPPFERRIWGGDGEVVAVHMLVATIEEGGMAIGAYDGDRMVGAVYGFATHEPHVLHSHYMAVEPEYRRTGLGVELKQRQRQWCLAHGRTAMRWTFDPLQLGNAHLNLRSLGAVGVAYHVNLYGSMGGINGGLPSDRLVVHWDLAAPRFTGQDHQVVEVPRVTADEIAGASPVAVAARHGLRNALHPLVQAGWLVVDVDRVERTYTLAR
jgi:chorismate synthase